MHLVKIKLNSLEPMWLPRAMPDSTCSETENVRPLQNLGLDEHPLPICELLGPLLGHKCFLDPSKPTSLRRRSLRVPHTQWANYMTVTS
jgi:hypothetical protein